MQGQGINASVNAYRENWKVGRPSFCEMRCWDDDRDHVGCTPSHAR